MTPSVASGVQVVSRKAEEGGSLVWLSTDDNAARRRLGDAQQDSGSFSTLLTTATDSGGTGGNR
jgi:hypothetical protein